MTLPQEIRKGAITQSERTTKGRKRIARGGGKVKGLAHPDVLLLGIPHNSLAAQWTQVFHVRCRPKAKAAQATGYDL